MLDNLIQLVQENAHDAIITNKAIPDHKNQEAINTAGNSIFNGMKSQAESGNLSDILNLFQSGSATSSNPVVSAVNNNTVSDLMKKFGLDQSAASSIAGQLIPKVMQQLVSKTNDSSDTSFDLNSIIGTLGGIKNNLG